ncbi:MAG: hypothetical protein M3R38_05935 [Actinomycetota bacterium]|nr:hypothetical protein [Actinomycetota bacterium]
MAIQRYVQHDVLAVFAAAKVNLSSERVANYRAQGKRLREKLERYI